MILPVCSSYCIYLKAGVLTIFFFFSFVCAATARGKPVQSCAYSYNRSIYPLFYGTTILDLE